MQSEKILQIMTEWIDNDKYTNHSQFAEYLVAQYPEEFEGVRTDAVRRNASNIYRKNFIDKEIVIENVKLAKQKQKFQDINNIKNKSFREFARIDNSLVEYTKALTNAIQKIKIPTIYHETINNPGVGIIHSSDLHLNELVEMHHNKYDFEIASKRLKKHITEAISYFRSKGISNVLYANTGDNLNSDRRLDELLNMSTNRGNATVLGAYLIKQALIELNRYFNVSVAYVTGNESRAKQEHGFSKILASDNYDSTLFSMLKMIFHDSKGITFAPDEPKELVIEVAGYNVLLLHGEAIPPGKDVEKTVQQIKGKYNDRGILIHFVMFGHVHSARIGDKYGRSSSMVGDNDYSDKLLQLSGRASQNLYIIYQDGSIDGLKVDLQNVDGIKGYDIIDELIAYNAKSVQKLHKPTPIFQVVI